METWHSDLLLSNGLAAEFRKSDITGYSLMPVNLSEPEKRPGVDKKAPLWELKVTGWGGVAPEKSGIRLLYRCPECRWSHYSELRRSELLFDTDQWDGSDMFMIWPLPVFVFVTENVRKLLERTQATGHLLTPIDRITTGHGGFSPGRLSHYMDEGRARMLSGAAGID